MASYQKVPTVESRNLPKNAATRAKELDQKINLVVERASPQIVAFLEKKIEERIAAGFRHYISVKYQDLDKEFGQNLPPQIWSRLVEQHYLPLGFEIGLNEEEFTLIFRRPKETKSCHLI